MSASASIRILSVDDHPLQGACSDDGRADRQSTTLAMHSAT